MLTAGDVVIEDVEEVLERLCAVGEKSGAEARMLTYAGIRLRMLTYAGVRRCLRGCVLWERRAGRRRCRYSVYLLDSYKSTNADT
jgi:hypothetical protein